MYKKLNLYLFFKRKEDYVDKLAEVRTRQIYTLI